MVRHVPGSMRPHGDDRIWNSGWTLSDAAGRHDHNHVSICHLQRHAPAFGARGYDRSVTVKANLSLPEQVRDRYPAVIIVHTIAGYRDANEGYVAAELRKAGFATLTYDSFAARGT